MNCADNHLFIPIKYEEIGIWQIIYSFTLLSVTFFSQISIGSVVNKNCIVVSHFSFIRRHQVVQQFSSGLLTNQISRYKRHKKEVFLFRVITVCHPLTFLAFSWRLYGKLSLGNIEEIGILVIDDFRNLRYLLRLRENEFIIM